MFLGFVIRFFTLSRPSNLSRSDANQSLLTISCGSSSLVRSDFDANPLSFVRLDFGTSQPSVIKLDLVVTSGIEIYKQAYLKN